MNYENNLEEKIDATKAWWTTNEHPEEGEDCPVMVTNANKMATIMTDLLRE